MSTSAHLVNRTEQPMKVFVRGGSHGASEVATVAAGYACVLGVADSGKYYIVEVGAPGSEKVITIPSGDLCENKLITILDEGGNLKAQKVPRQSSTAAKTGTTTAIAAKKRSLLRRVVSKTVSIICAVSAVANIAGFFDSL